MPKYAWLLEYDGRPFCGWQSQPPGSTTLPSVQRTLSNAIADTIQTPVKLVGASRTDAGVSARYQVAHAELPRYPIAQLQHGTQHRLRGTPISIKQVAEVHDTFHARHSALGKTYTYQILNQPYPPALRQDYGWWIRQPLSLHAMRAASKHFLGTHNFAGFRSKHCVNHPVRTITDITLRQDGCVITIHVHGRSFLMHQVRVMVGALVAIGVGKRVDIPGILQSGQRHSACQNASPYGLTLEYVDYGNTFTN